MNEETKLKDDEDIITTNLGWTVKKVELFGAIMAFSRRENSNVHDLRETQIFDLQINLNQITMRIYHYFANHSGSKVQG